jgi:two-component system NtrC family response regulator
MLEFHGGNRQQTADTLGISRKTLYRKLTEYAID